MKNLSDNLIGIMIDPCPDLLTGLFGIIRSGNGFVPLDPTLPNERLRFILDDCQIALLLTKDKFLAKTIEIFKKSTSLQKIVCLDKTTQTVPDFVTIYDDKKALLKDPIGEQNDIKPEQLVYVIYTSGTTGLPKGVPISHQNLCPLLDWSREYFKFDEQTTVLQNLNYAFDFGIFELLTTLLFDGTLHIRDKDAQLDASSFVHYMNEHGINTLHTTPSFFRHIANHGQKLESLKVLHLGGETLTSDMVNSFFAVLNDDCLVYNGYGPTEATINCAIFALGNQKVWKEMNYENIPIGKPSANNHLYILDKNAQLVPIGVSGELQVGGVALTHGYLKRPELTAEKFIKNPFSDDPNSRLYKTGDLARYLPDGNIEYLGRIDNQVKIRGFRIELGEIEAALVKHPGVLENAVIVHEASKTDKRLIAYLVPNQGQVIENTALRDFLKERLPNYMIPSAFVTLENLPLTPNGKIDRQALSQILIDSSDLSEKTYVAPRTKDEKLLAEIWAEVLGIERPGIHDNFFDLGGHSILAVSLLAQIEQQFGQQLPLSALFQGATIAELAKLLNSSTNTSNQWTPLVAIQPFGTKQPLFCIPGAGGNVLYYYQLARHLGEDQPFYGLQAVGLDGETAPDTRIEDMAVRYVQEIQTVDPQGPYLLGGHSFGSWVALEMAKQLQLKGHKVAKLLIFDTTVPLNQPIGLDWDEAQWTTDVARIIERLLDKELPLSLTDFQQLEPSAQLELLHEKLVENEWAISKPQLHGLIKTFKANSQAEYIPQDIQPIPISLFIAKEILTETASGIEMERLRETLKQQTDWGWSQYASGSVDIHVVPGDHHTMMSQPHVQILAEKLKKCLKKCL